MSVAPDMRAAPPGMVLFTQPPPDLGPVHAAWTNAKQSAYYGTERRRWIITGGLWVMLVVVVEVFLTRVINVPSERFPFRIIFHPFVAAFALLFSFALRYRGKCKFVCENGIAQYTLVGTFPGKVKEHIFRFKQQGLVPQFNITSYRGLLLPLKGDWNLSWAEPSSGGVVFELRGTFSRWRREPDPVDPEYALALAAREAYLRWEAGVASNQPYAGDTIPPKPVTLAAAAAGPKGGPRAAFEATLAGKNSAQATERFRIFLWGTVLAGIVALPIVTYFLARVPDPVDAEKPTTKSPSLQERRSAETNGPHNSTTNLKGKSQP